MSNSNVPHHTQVNPRFCELCCAAWHSISGCGFQFFNENGGLCHWTEEMANESIKQLQAQKGNDRKVRTITFHRKSRKNAA